MNERNREYEKHEVLLLGHGQFNRHLFNTMEAQVIARDFEIKKFTICLSSEVIYFSQVIVKPTFLVGMLVYIFIKTHLEMSSSHSFLKYERLMSHNVVESTY